MKLRNLCMAALLALGMSGAGVGADLPGEWGAPAGVSDMMPPGARADAYGLAAVPSEVSAVFGLFDIPGLLDELEKAGVYKKSPDSAIPVKDVVIATGPGLAEWLNERKDKVADFDFRDLAFLQEWAMNPQRINHRNLPMPFLLKLAGYPDFRRSESAAAPLILSVRFEQKMADELRREVFGIEFEDELRDWGVTDLFTKNYHGTDFKVARVDGSALRRKLESRYVHEEKLGKDAAQIREGLKNLDGATLYVGACFIEDRMAVILTTNPEKQLRLASGAGGVAANSFCARAAGLLKPAMHAFGYVEPAAVKAVLKMAAARQEAELERGRELLTEKCRQYRVLDTRGTLAAYDSFAGRMKAWFHKLTADSKDWSFVCWRENGLNMELGLVTDGLFKLTPGSLTNALPPGADDVIYYHAHFNMDVFAQYRLLLEDFVRGGWHMTEAYALSSRNNLNDQMRVAIPLIKLNETAIGQLWSALKDAQDCMTGENTFVLDMKGEPSAYTPDLPSLRFAYLCGLKNRHALSRAWDKVVVASRPAASLLSGGKMGQIPPAESVVEGDTTIYYYNLPYGAQLTPVVRVSDGSWGIAMPKEFATAPRGNAVSPSDAVSPLDIRLNFTALRQALAGGKFSPETEQSVKEWVNKTRLLKGIRLSGKKSPDNKDYYRLQLIYGKNGKE